jgi:hypothetical protein
MTRRSHKCEIPQGTILRPLMVLRFINIHQIFCRIHSPNENADDAHLTYHTGNIWTTLIHS